MSAFPARRASGFPIHRGTGVAFARVANTRILVTCALALALVPRAGRALPDLSPEIYDVTIETGVTVASGDVAEGCAATTDNPILIRFGVPLAQSRSGRARHGRSGMSRLRHPSERGVRE